MKTGNDRIDNAKRDYLKIVIEEIELMVGTEQDMRTAFLAALHSGIIQEELRKACGVSQATISRWTGGASLPRNQTVRRAYVTALCDYLRTLL